MITPNPPVAGNAQIWDNPAAGRQSEDSKMDTEEPGERQSLYVEIFDSMQEIVMKREKFLFSSAEHACFERLATMSYPARYLLIRLCLCRRGKWHTLGSLEQRYKIEIGGKQHISDAIDELCGIIRQAPSEVKREDPEVIDLTLDEDENLVANSELWATPNASNSSSVHHGKNVVASTSKTKQDSSGSRLIAFAVDDTGAELPELLACLTNDELKIIGKQMKVAKTSQNRSALMESILSSASNQSTLAFPVLTSRNNAAKSGGAPMRQLTLNFAKDGKMKAQTLVVRQLVSKVIGRCIRIDPAIFALFDRLNLVFFRSTTHTSSLLLPALLAAFRKRQYVKVEYIRTASIFPSRKALLDYEEALVLESRVDAAFDIDNTAFSPAQKFMPKAKAIKGKGKLRAETAHSKMSSRVKGAKVIYEIWMSVYDRWKSLVSCKEEEAEKVQGLERFDCGHVLTRIMYKGAQALSILKEYDLEIEVLEALLTQTKWRRGRRGAWYERLALVLATHSEKTEGMRKAAMDVVIRGLQDELTHLTYRPRLERRLTRLEKMLKIPMNERHQCGAKLKKAEEVVIEGVRVKNRTASLNLDKSGRMKNVTDSPFKPRSKSGNPFTISRSSTQSPERGTDGETVKKVESKGKSRWIGRNGEEVSVEHLALQFYEDLGFKGFHSEGRIVSTIFGLLFWDVIFASVPGAFETPYQSAPLDIHEDSFYSARRELIEQRLKELEDGKALELLGAVDDRERPSQTWCIGVNWAFKRDDLLEIADCLGGHVLAIICRMICEDYGQWGGGVPDLFVWNPKTRMCKFVEVKSPSDSLQENQKVWIDILVGSDTSVDLCLVAEKGTGEKKRMKKNLSTGKNRKDAVISSDVESEEGLEVSEQEDIDHRESIDVVPKVPEGSKRACDSDDFVPSPTKRRKVEVEVLLTPRSRRKCSSG